MVFNRPFEGQGICVMWGVIVFMFSDQLQFLHPMNYLLSNYFLLQVTVASFLSLVFFFCKMKLIRALAADSSLVS